MYSSLEILLVDHHVELKKEIPKVESLKLIV